MKKIRFYLQTDIEFFKSQNIDFKNSMTVKNTNTTISVNSEGFEFLTSEDTFFFQKKHFCLLSKIKQEIKQNFTDEHFYFTNVFHGNMRVFDYNYLNDLNIIYENACEIDVNSCYITSAKLLKLISKETFDKINHLPKNARLRILGAIATKKIIETYEAGELVNTEIVQDEQLFFAWKCIVNYSYLKILEVCKKLKDDFTLFWVDALFIKNKEQQNEVKNELEKLGYNSKVKNIEYMYFSNEIPNDKNLKFFNLTVKKENEPLTYFCLPNYNIL